MFEKNMKIDYRLCIISMFMLICICTIFNVLHLNGCNERHRHNGEHCHCGDGSIGVRTAVKGLVVHMRDDGEYPCIGLLAGRLDLLLR